MRKRSESLLPFLVLLGAAVVAGCAAVRPSNENRAAGSCPRATTLEPEAIQREAACRLAEYVRIDSQNPGRGEAATAAYLKSWLEAEGIASEIVESAPGRANLIARLPGKRSDGALLLLHHMDVVPADEGEWSVPPFAGLERDGFVWGRGSLDDKGPGVIQFLAAILLKRRGVVLEHDLVLAAVADEEAGGGQGARYLVSRRRDLLRGVEHVLNEGGAIVEAPPGNVQYSVEVGQKAPLWLRLTARGKSGHASTPQVDSAVDRLVRALAKLSRFEFPVVLTPEVERLFAEKAATLPEPLKKGAATLSSSMKDPVYRKAFLEDPRRSALVRNTFAITMLEGSDKENVIPGDASAVVDLRLLAGQDPEAVTRTLSAALDDPGIEIETLLSWSAASRSPDEALFGAIRALASRRDPGAPVFANVIAGFTDCNAFRSIGLGCLGFTPIRLAPESFAGVHGKDERIAVAAMGDAVVASFELAKSIVGAAAPTDETASRPAGR